jgi:hypothetical protein
MAKMSGLRKNGTNALALVEPCPPGNRIFMKIKYNSSLKIDRISQFSHLAGGFIGAVYGFVRSRRK